MSTQQELEELSERYRQIMDNHVGMIGPGYYKASIKYCQVRLAWFRLRYYHKPFMERLFERLTKTGYPLQKDYVEYRTFYLDMIDRARKGVREWEGIKKDIDSAYEMYIQNALAQVQFKYVQ